MGGRGLSSAGTEWEQLASFSEDGNEASDSI
jgi:hypothetical protein